MNIIMKKTKMRLTLDRVLKLVFLFPYKSVKLQNIFVFYYTLGYYIVVVAM